MLDAAKPHVGLFVTCLVDAFRPAVGFAAIKLLERAGATVEVPQTQTCCGQPGYNSGARDLARDIAKQVVAAFEPFDYVVAPSGSCAGMIKVHYPDLFEDEPEWRERARALAAKTHELFSFLTDILNFDETDAALEGRVAYHDSCSGLRELGVYRQPRRLMTNVRGLELTPVEDGEACCGFGGTFCVKYPEISTAIVDRKIDAVTKSGADYLLGGDLGCLLNMAGRLSRRGQATKVYHLAEVLAGVGDPPLCRKDP